MHNTPPRTVMVFLMLAAPILSAGCSSPKYVVSPTDLKGFDHVELPLAFTGRQGRFAIVAARIQGREYKLMLDSGDYAALALRPEAIDELGVEITGRQRYRDLTGRLFDGRRFVAPAVQLDSLTLTGVPGREDLVGPIEYDGTVGRGLLANFYALIDYAGKRLTLYRRDREPAFLNPEDWLRHDCAGPMQIEVQLDGLGRPYKIGLDSGVGRTFVRVDSELGRAMRSALRPFKVEPGTINDVPADEIRFYRIGRAFLGDHDLGATTCVVGPAARYMGNGIMGYDFFRDNVVLADFVKQVIWIKKKRG